MSELANTEVRSRLEDILSRGLIYDIYYLEEALSLEELIGREAAKLNAASFSALFGSLQQILRRALVLHAARLFERHNTRFQIRSIPAAIALLREQAEYLAIPQRLGMVKVLIAAGAKRDEIDSLAGPELTRFVAEFFDSKLRESHADGVENARVLDALKTVRDKQVAHPESIEASQLPQATFAEIDQLLALAKIFQDAVGFGYLGIVYEPTGGTFAARRSTTSLRRLLHQAGIEVDNRPHLNLS